MNDDDDGDNDDDKFMRQDSLFDTSLNMVQNYFLFFYVHVTRTSIHFPVYKQWVV